MTAETSSGFKVSCIWDGRGGGGGGGKRWSRKAVECRITQQDRSANSGSRMELVINDSRDSSSACRMSLERVVEIMQSLRYNSGNSSEVEKGFAARGEMIRTVKQSLLRLVEFLYFWRRNSLVKRRKLKLRSDRELMEKLRLFVERVRRVQHQIGNLRLGLTCSSLWNACKMAYTSRVSSILITDIVSRRLCCPASIIYKHFERHISWRRLSRRCRNRDEDSWGSSGDGNDKVDCKVDVVSWRERFITASINIQAGVDRVWEVLTDYERLAEFIPNLVHSTRIPCPYPGRIWLLQRGLHTAMYWHIEATVVLDLEEFPCSFCMVDGDFKKYAGRWLLQPGTRPGTTDLTYEVNVIPRLLLPGVFVERIIKSDLPVNLHAIAERAENNQRIVEKYPADDAGMPVTTPTKSIVSKVRAETQATSFVQSGDRIYAEKWDYEASTRIKKTCKGETACTVDEVHLRRLTEEDGGFWRVVASVTVAAPVEDVWNVLTSYETLPEFVPNLSSSKMISRSGKRVRLLQEGCKCLLYMVLHARVVLELYESPANEIAFEQVEGDFSFFKGKWTLESLGTHHTLLKYSVDMKMYNDSLLPREIIEEVVYEDLPENLCAIRARAELGDGCFVFLGQDSPPTSSVESDVNRPVDKKPKRKPVPGLQRDVKVLERELKDFIVKLGRDRVMPMRGELRRHGRVDLEKAISRFGGFTAIAQKLNLSLAYKQRKPRGYWDNIENLRQEVPPGGILNPLQILLFQKKTFGDPTYIPSRRTFERAGRYDIARALEKWGGLHEVANILNLRTRKKKKRSSDQEEAWEDWKPSPPLEDDTNESPQCQAAGDKAPVKISLPEAPTKWLKVDKE